MKKTNKQLTREPFDDAGVDNFDVFRLLDAAASPMALYHA